MNRDDMPVACHIAPCLYPNCCPRAWTPADPSPANVKAFLDDVHAFMAETGKPFGKAAARVIADRRGCVLS